MILNSWIHFFFKLKSILDMSGIIQAFITQTSDFLICCNNYDEKVWPYLNNNKVPDAVILISSRSHHLVFPPETPQQYIVFQVGPLILHLNYGSKWINYYNKTSPDSPSTALRAHALVEGGRKMTSLLLLRIPKKSDWLWRKNQLKFPAISISYSNK